MEGITNRTATRRGALAAGLGALAALALPAAGAAAAGEGGLLFTAGGITGGGLVRLPGGEANCSILATAMKRDGKDPVVMGQVRWADNSYGGRAGVFESIAVTDCIAEPAGSNVRKVRGTMKLDGTGSYPFELRATVAGTPGSGQSTVSLTVQTDGPKGTYIGVGTLASGDLALLNFKVKG